MRLAIALCVLAVVSGCKKKDDKGGAAAGSGSAGAASAGSGGSAGASAGSTASGAGSGLAFDEPKASEDDLPDVLPLIFGGKVPRTPAVSPDGTLYATIESPVVGMMMPPMPYDLVLRTVNSADESARITLFSVDEAVALAAEIEKGSGGSGWATPALQAKLAARAAPALAKLARYHTLTMSDVNWGDDTKKPLTFGDATLVAREGDDRATVELLDGKQRVLHRAVVDAYTVSSGDGGCGYTPKLFAAGTDGPMLYITVGYRFRDDCQEPKPTIFGWSLDPAKGSPDDAATGILEHQLAQPAPVPPVTNGDVVAKAKEQVLDDVLITTSKDGKSAWASGATADVRASDVLVKTPAGWQIVGAAWTLGVENDAANRDAKAGKLKPRTLDGGPGDASLADAFKKLTTDGVDAAASKRDDLVAIGSGPGERTIGGALFARAWNAGWKGKTSIDSLVAKLAPSGTTGWVAASVQLQKAGYKIPFLVFAVFDKGADGAWSLVHIHFAV